MLIGLKLPDNRRRNNRDIKRKAQTGIVPRKRFKELAIAGIVGVVAWTSYYLTYGSYQISSLDEFESYLRGENLYRKYDVFRIVLDCEELRTQFDKRYLAIDQNRIKREQNSLIFMRENIGREAFDAWTKTAVQNLSFGQARKVKNAAFLKSAMMVRLFPEFRFETDQFSHTLRNDLSPKCNDATS